MTRRVVVRCVALLAVLAVSAFTALTYPSYQRDIRDTRERIAAGSPIVDTRCGRIEYAVAGGEGPTVLAVHGAGGGYDQGLEIADRLVQRGFRVVAVSRFGYLRATLPADASPAAQADAYA